MNSVVLSFCFLLLEFTKIVSAKNDDDDDDDDKNNNNHDDNDDDFWAIFESYEKGSLYPGSNDEFTTFMLIIGLFFWPFIIFIGYRIFKVTLFTIGGLTCGIICSHLALISGESTLVCIIIFIIFFLIGGSIIICCYRMGVFLIGYWAGTFISLSFMNVFDQQNWYTTNEYTFWVILILFGIVGGFIALIYERNLIICATSGLGSYFWITTWDHFFKGGNRYGIYFTIVLFFILGCYIQHHITSPIEDGHPMNRTLIPTKNEFKEYYKRIMILYYGDDYDDGRTKINVLLLHEPLTQQHTEDTSQRRSRRRQERSRQQQTRSERRRHSPSPPPQQTSTTNTSNTTATTTTAAAAEEVEEEPVVYAAEVIEQEYIPATYAVPFGECEDSMSVMPNELTKWFQSFGITNQQTLRELAPLFTQVGATEPMEIVEVVNDKEVGRTWLLSLEQALPLAKRKTVLSAINKLRDTS